MDLATLFGLVGTLVVLVTAIVLGGSVGAFVDSAAIVLVIGGTLLVTLMKFSFPQFLNATKVAIKAFIYRVPEPEALIDTSIYLANQARAANDTAANRALNRRVDITFANGRDRPGAFTGEPPAVEP